MSDTIIPMNPAEGETSFFLVIGKILFFLFIMPPFSAIGWTTLGLSVYIIQRFRYPHCESKAEMKGKTVIVTGANKGIGLETARDLARRGATVILACRNMIRANTAKDEIEASGGRHVEVMELDVASMESVRKFAKKLQNRQIDVLINNAGVADLPQQITEEGLELTVATNHLGHFLLTHLLMPNLKVGRGQVINLTSIGHKWVKNAKELDLDNDMRFQLNRPLKTLEIYKAAKLMNLIFTAELARKVHGTGEYEAIFMENDRVYGTVSVQIG
ncbi:hypothetical protein SK128_003196 [Halocaridina rubra]|uniref:Uncharacterized protein n=1 Tax=Halocaridina rubra TaxID=373956 RepID=A0AAN8XDK8_HALRR